MTCCYHPERDAVAVCVHCQRGVCRDCAAEVNGRTACAGHCDTAAEALGSADLTPRQKTRFLKGFIALMVFGALLMAFGYYERAHPINDYDIPWVRLGSMLIIYPLYFILMYFLTIYKYWWTRLKKRTFATGDATPEVKVRR